MRRRCESSWASGKRTRLSNICDRLYKKSRAQERQDREDDIAALMRLEPYEQTPRGMPKTPLGLLHSINKKLAINAANNDWIYDERVREDVDQATALAEIQNKRDTRFDLLRKSILRTSDRLSAPRIIKTT